MATSKPVVKSNRESRKAKAAALDSKLVRKRLAELRPVLANAVVGDFSKDLKLPDAEDEFTELFVGVQMMQEVIREQLQELQELNQSLEAKAIDRSRALEEAQTLTHLGSWEWEIASNVLSWSDELYRIYGLEPQERTIGYEEFISMIHPEDRQRVQDAITHSYQTGKPYEFEHRIILPGGSERILRGMGKTDLDAAGNPVRMVGTAQDVTIAKQLDRAKDEFISLVSHQLRTPLTVIRVHGNMLEDGILGQLTSEQQVHVHTMTDASIRLIKLVDEILSISRVSLNRVKVKSVPTDANKLIKSCVEEARHIADTKGVTIGYIPDKSIGSLLLDPVIFGEILRNLIDNAIRYTPKDQGRIVITFTEEKQWYQLTVADNGIGVPETERANIFERFYRANNATVAASEGSGLGLYIVKHFIEASGGQVWFESEEGKGATFYVSFPLEGMRSMYTGKAE